MTTMSMRGLGTFDVAVGLYKKDDPYIKWSVLKTIQEKSDYSNDLVTTVIHYRNRNNCWRFSRLVWFLVQVIFTGTLALWFSPYTKNTLIQLKTGREIQAYQYYKEKEDEPTTPKPPSPNSGTSPVNFAHVDPFEEPAAPIAPVKPVDPTLNLDGISKEIAEKLEYIHETEKVIRKIYAEVGKKNVPTAAQQIDIDKQLELLQPVYEQMIRDFKGSKYCNQYGYNFSQDNKLFSFTLGNSVDQYYAQATNICSQYSIKFRTLIGYLNLLKFGPEILDEMKAKLFIENIKNYKETFSKTGGTGLQKMHYLTGNVVDLNTPIRDVTDDWDAISKARGMIELFIEEFADFKKQFPGRVIGYTNDWNSPNGYSLQLGSTVYFASKNTDRGNHPVWSFDNTGNGRKYCVNVPNTQEVIDALLVAPLLLAKSYLIIQAKYEGREKERRKDEFFAQCLSIGCFNEKLGAILNHYTEKYHPLITNKDTSKQIWLSEPEFAKVSKSKVFPLDDPSLKEKSIESIFIEDEAILPPLNARMEFETWKKLALSKYIAKAKSENLLDKCYISMIENGEKKYRKFDVSTIEFVMRRFAVCDATTYVDFRFSDKGLI